MKIKSCPICGKQWENHCHHYDACDGRDIPTVEMEAADALKLLDQTLEGAIGEVRDIADQRIAYLKLLEQNQT